MLFSGETPAYELVDQQPSTQDAQVVRLATADRDREVYVALTRAKRTLTVLWDPDDERPNMALHPVLERAFSRSAGKPYASFPEVTVKEWLDE
jgi:DNA helicase-2/ATP-dependent DNA helicase PcrA